MPKSRPRTQPGSPESEFYPIHSINYRMDTHTKAPGSLTALTTQQLKALKSSEEEQVLTLQLLAN